METTGGGSRRPAKGHLQDLPRRKRLRTERHGRRPVLAFIQWHSEREPGNHLRVQGPANRANLGTNQLSPCGDHVLEHSCRDTGHYTK